MNELRKTQRSHDFWEAVSSVCFFAGLLVVLYALLAIGGAS